jgi:hypothetical protein
VPTADGSALGLNRRANSGGCILTLFLISDWEEKPPSPGQAGRAAPSSRTVSRCTHPGQFLNFLVDFSDDESDNKKIAPIKAVHRTYLFQRSVMYLNSRNGWSVRAELHQKNMLYFCELENLILDLHCEL